MSANSGAIRAGRAFVELFADNTKLQQGLRVAEAQLKEFGAKVSSMGKQIATLGGVAALPGIISTKIFAGFDDQMRAVQAVTGSTGEAFDKLTEKAKYLGRTTSFTAKEVASGMLELGRAGFKSDEIDEAIAHVMNLARSTQTEIPRATEIAGNALRGFGLDANEMGRVSDVLATTANNSAQTLDDLGEAFKYVAPIADTAGMSLEETAKVLGTLANFGIKGSLAGTAVKNILTRMADPDVQESYERLGVKVKDAEGNLRNMADVLREVGQATASMPNAEKLAIFKELFDMRALAGGAKLTAESFQSLCDAIDNASGESDRVAKQMDAGIGGSFRSLFSAVEGAAIAIGSTLAPEVQRLSDYLKESTTSITEWLNEHKETIISCTKLAAKVLLLGVGLYAVGTAASAVANIIGLFRGSLVAVRVIVSALCTDLSTFGKMFTNLGSLFKPIEPVNASVDSKSAANIQTLATSSASATASVTQLNVALNAMRTAAAGCTQAITALLTPLSQLLNLLRPVGVQLSQNAKSTTLFTHALTPLSKSLTATATASARLTSAETALGRAYTGMNTRITVNTTSLRENHAAAKLSATGIRSTRTATVSAAKGFASYTAAIKANTQAITENVQAGGVAPGMYFQNAAAVETESAALAKNDAARTANASVIAETTAQRSTETASIAANTTATETSTASITAEATATGTSTEVLAAHTAAQQQAATASTALTGTTNASTTSTIAETAATTASTEATVVNATAQESEAASYALSTTAADANTVSVAGNTIATESNAVSVSTDTQSLAGNTISLQGNSAALVQNTTATMANDTAVKTLATDSAMATGIFSKMGTAISTTFAAKTGGFLALSNKEAFTATANAMSSAWTSATTAVTSSFNAIRGAAAGTLSSIGSLFAQTSGAVQGFSLASTVAAVKTTALTAVQKINTAITGMSRAAYAGATAALGIFSTANIASAASVVKVTTVSIAAKGAVTAYGIAATICAGATKALTAALTLVCAHPVAAALTALGVVLAGLCIYLKDAGKYTAQLSDEMTKLAEAGNKTRTLDDKKMEGIGKLGAKSEKGSLSDEEFTKGKSWVEELTGRYGDLGIQIDEVNKKIIVATDSQKKFLEAVNQKALQDKNSVIKEEEKNLAELEKEYQSKVDRMQGWSGWLAMEARGVGQVFTLGYVDSAEEAWPKQLEEENKKIEEQKKKLAELRKERQMLEGGDTTIAKGGSIEESVQNQVDNINPSANAPGSPAEFEEKLRNTEGSKQQEEIAALQSEYQQAVAQIQSQINGAMTQEEKDAGTARLERLDKMFTAKMAELTAALPENKAQSDFWDKINDKGMSEEEKEIAQLNKDLTTVLEAIKTEVANAANNTKEGDVPQINVSASELTTAYQPELETVSAKSDGAKSLVEKATSGEYTSPEEFQTDSQKVIGELDKTLEGMDPGPEREKLAAAIEALKIFCETFAKTIGSEDKSTKVDAVTGSGIKQKAAQNATDTQIQGVRDKYTKERQQKMKDTEIEDLPLNQAAQNRDTKKMALDTAKAGGDKKQIRKAQLEYDQASNEYGETERNKHQNDLDSSAKEMQTALDDYNNAGDDTAKREDAKRRYDTAKSKHDSAQSFFNEKGSPQSQQIAANTRQAKTKRDEKKIALDEAIESGDRKKIAQAQKEYNTSQKEYENAQYKQNLNTATQTADQNIESTSASFEEKKFNLQQAQMTGDPEQIEQAQSEYNEADYAKKQAEYQKAMADAQNSAQEVSDAEKNLKEVMKHGTPEEKAAAKQRLKEAKANQKDAFKRLKSFDTGKAVRSASPDYSNPQSSNESGEKGEQEKTEVKDTASGTFDAFKALGQNYDWQKTNGEKQLHTLVDIRSLLQQQQDGMYI